MAGITRREWLGVAAGGAAAVALAAAGAGCTGLRRGGVAHQNAEFYAADGKFDQEAAKKAYYALMEHHGYPVYDNLRKNMWVADFTVGRFTDVGMGGIFWINEKEGAYLGHEIFLLPGQMIPEHWHVKTAEAAAKMEAWQVRYGGVTLFSEGAASPGAEKVIPMRELAFTTCRCMQKVAPGDLGKLEKAEAKHFMVAGPEGAIVTEYASYHDGGALRFTNPKVKL